MTAAPDDPTITARTAVRPLAAGTMLADRFRIEALIGMGGMGVVYRATDTALATPVALKLLRPELVLREDGFDRMRQEVLHARQISSPHVLRIHDVGRDGERWFISMDLVEGEALDQRLSRSGPLSIDEALSITRQVAEGLVAAHAQGIVHRDLKPSNILIDAQGRAQIADFGIARSLRSSGMTEAGAVIGTPDYLSPEQASGRPVDARSDLYALGLLLYEMLSGRLPFSGETPAENLSQRLGGYLVPITTFRPELPRWIQRLLNTLLRPRPSQRLQSAEDVLEAMRTRRVPIPWRRLLVPALGMGLLLVLAVGVARWVATTDVTAVAPAPPERLLLRLDVSPDLGWSENRRIAVAELMRLDLAEGLRTALVDGQRGEPALARWQGPADDPASRARLQDELRHRHLLNIRLESVEGRPAATAEWYEAGSEQAVLRMARVPGSVESAWSELRRRIAVERPEILDPAIHSQPDEANLAEAPWVEDFGAAVQARWLGKFDPAGALLSGIPNSVLAAQLLRVELALSTGDLAAARTRLDELGDFRGTEPTQVALLRARATGEPDEVVRVARAHLTAWPHDTPWSWQLADALIALGELTEAESVLVQALAVDDGDPRGWFLRGKVSILQGNMRVAVDDHLVRAVLMNKRDRNRSGEAEALNALGIGYARLGQLEDAEEQYRRALALREQLGDLRGEASSLRNLAQILMIRGAHEEAASMLDRARSHLTAIDDRAGLAAVENERGLLAEERGDYVTALQAYRTAMRAREAFGDRQGVAESLNNLGYAQFQLGDYDSAALYWRSSIEKSTEVGDQLGAVRAAQNLGLLESLRGHWDIAQSLLDGALETAGRHQLTEEIAVCQRNLAELALLQGDLAGALAHRQQAAALFDERDDQRGRFDAGLLEARIALLARDAGATQTALQGIAPSLDDVSVEQRVWWSLLKADLAELEQDTTSRAEHLEQAGEGASRSGIRRLQLAARVRTEPLSRGLREEVIAFGDHATLLLWARHALALSGDTGFYAELIDLLGTGADLPTAWELHSLGASRLRTAGDETAASQAHERSSQALQRLQQRTPPALRAEIDRMLAEDRP